MVVMDRLAYNRLVTQTRRIVDADPAELVCALRAAAADLAALVASGRLSRTVVERVLLTAAHRRGLPVATARHLVTGPLTSALN